MPVRCQQQQFESSYRAGRVVFLFCMPNIRICSNLTEQALQARCTTKDCRDCPDKSQVSHVSVCPQPRSCAPPRPYLKDVGTRQRQDCRQEASQQIKQSRTAVSSWQDCPLSQKGQVCHTYWGWCSSLPGKPMMPLRTSTLSRPCRCIHFVRQSAVPKKYACC